MGKTIALFMVICMIIANCSISAATGEEAKPVGIISNFLYNHSVQDFLEKRGILTEDREAYDYANAFLAAAMEKDVASMKALFAPNAVSDIGEEQLDQMLEAFTNYFQVDAFTLEIPIGPSTSESMDHGKRSKELRGPLVIVSDRCEYRLAIKCISRDDWDGDNIGIWSIYIIEKSKDTDNNPDHHYRGDNKYRTGIYFDVSRPAIARAD